MRDTLEACLSATYLAISKHGNVYMFPDPLLCKMPPVSSTGLELRAHSTMVPGLKWIDLVHIIWGIEQAMWQRALYKEAVVKMYDEPSGLFMGVVELEKSSAIKPVDIGD